MITGAARGLGFALVEECARLGIKVFAVVRKSEDAEALAVRFSQICVPIVVDLCDPSSEGIISESLKKSALALDVLINNAGVPGSGSILTEVNLEQVDQLFQVHCIAALRCARASLPFLVKAARPVIINVSSRLGSISKVASGAFDEEEHSYAYRIAKAAQNMATACLRAEFRDRGVSVIALHPGKLKTALSSHQDGAAPAEAARKILAQAKGAALGSRGGFTDADGNPLEW